MAKYIDAEELLQKLPDDLPYKASVKRVLMQAPAEEVVSKDLLKELYEQYTYERDVAIDQLHSYGVELGQKKELAEVRHGEWVPVQYTYFGLKRYECSECKDDEYWQKRYLEHKEKYCPNCGAKMDGRSGT